MVQRISVRGMTSADADTVYALLRDGESWPEWSPLGSFELVREGEDEPEGRTALQKIAGDTYLHYLEHRRWIIEMQT